MMQYVEALVEKGKVEINPVDKNKKTPMNYVDEKIKKGKKFQELFKYMKEKGGKLDWREL